MSRDALATAGRAPGRLRQRHPAGADLLLVSADPRSLDPALSTDVPTGEAVTLLFDNLTQFDPEGRLVPGIATRWWPSTDGRTWTFRIRRGVRFHDGRPLDVAAVTGLLSSGPADAAGGRPDLAAAPDRRGQRRGRLRSRVTRLSGLVVLDDSTIAFTPHRTAEHLPQAAGDAGGGDRPDPDGRGLRRGSRSGAGHGSSCRWSHDDLLVFARNDAGGDRSPADTLRIRIIPEIFTQAAEYESWAALGGGDSRGETRALGNRPRPANCSDAPPCAMYVAINTTRGAARRRARPARHQPRRQHPGDPRPGDARSRRARGRHHSPGARGSRSEPAPGTATIPSRPAPCSPRRVMRTA